MNEEYLRVKAENELLKSRLRGLRDSKSSGFFDINSQQREELI